MAAAALRGKKNRLCPAPPPAPTTNPSLSRPFQDILKAPPRADVQRAMKEMKTALTATHFSLGEDPIEYTSCIQRQQEETAQAAATGTMAQYRGVLQKDVQKFIKKSSCFFGSDGPSYSTTMAEATVPRQVSIATLAAQRKNAKFLKKELQTTTIEISTNHHMPWTTELSSAYVQDVAAAAPAAAATTTSAEPRPVLLQPPQCCCYAQHRYYYNY